LQEIGRAGRDGHPAQAIAIILRDEILSKHSLSHSDKISLSQATALLLMMQHIYKDTCESGDSSGNIVPNSKTIDLALPILSTVQSIDCKEETIQTILSLLEDNSHSFPKLLDIEGIIPNVARCILKRRTIEKLACEEPLARCIHACGTQIDARSKAGNGQVESSSAFNQVSKYGGTASQKGFAAYSFGVFEFSIVKCARLLGPNAEPRHVFAALRRLQSSGELELSFDSMTGKSIHLKLNSEGINFFNLTPDGKDDPNCINWLSNVIIEHFTKQYTNRVKKVVEMNQIMHRVSAVESLDASLTKKDKNTEKEVKQKSGRLLAFQEMIHQYLDSDGCDDSVDSSSLCNNITHDIGDFDCEDAHTMSRLSADVESLLHHPSLVKPCTSSSIVVEFGEEKSLDYTSLCICKILHGIDSPRIPVLDWYQHPLWGKWRTGKFPSILEAVTTIISNF